MKNNISRTLATLMAERNVTQTQLALAIGVSNAAISYWLNGLKEATADNIISLADYFEVSTDYLLGRSNDVGVIETNANLTPFQNNLLAVVAKLPRDDQFQVLGFAQALASN